MLQSSSRSWKNIIFSSYGIILFLFHFLLASLPFTTTYSCSHPYQFSFFLLKVRLIVHCSLCFEKQTTFILFPFLFFQSKFQVDERWKNDYEAFASLPRTESSNHHNSVHRIWSNKERIKGSKFYLSYYYVIHRIDTEIVWSVWIWFAWFDILHFVFSIIFFLCSCLSLSCERKTEISCIWLIR